MICLQEIKMLIDDAQRKSSQLIRSFHSQYSMWDRVKQNINDFKLMYSSKVNQKFEQLLKQNVMQAIDFLNNKNIIRFVNQFNIDTIFQSISNEIELKKMIEIIKLFVVEKNIPLKQKNLRSFMQSCYILGNYQMISQLEEISFANKQNQIQYVLIQCLLIENIIYQKNVQQAYEKFLQFIKQYNSSDKQSLQIVNELFEQLFKLSVDKQAVSDKNLWKNILQLSSYFQMHVLVFNKLIDFVSKKENIEIVERIYQLMLELKVQPSIVTYNSLLDCYFKCKQPSKAFQIFDILELSKDEKIQSDNFTYTIMITGVKNFLDNGLSMVFKLLRDYQQKHQNADINMYNCVLDACVTHNDMNQAIMLMKEISQNQNIIADVVTYNTMIKGCARTKDLNLANQFYYQMLEIKIKPNKITFNQLIDLSMKSGTIDQAWKFYDEMKIQNVIPDSFTFSIIVTGLKTNKAPKIDLYKTLQEIQVLQQNPSFESDEILYNSLMDVCLKFGEHQQALQLYQQMKSNLKPSLITYGILIRVYGQINQLDKAFEIYDLIKSNNLKIGDITYGCLLDACVKNKRLDLAQKFLQSLQKDGIQLNTVIYTTLIHGFSNLGQLDGALNIFKMMKNNSATQPNLITYNSIMDACVKQNQIEKCLEFFNEMKLSNLKPDMITFSTIMKGLCSQNQVDKSYLIFKEMRQANIKSDDCAINLLLENCILNHRYDIGIMIWQELMHSNLDISVKTYINIIKIFGQTKKIEECFKIVEVMKHKNVTPDLQIYAQLFQSCFSAKQIQRAQELFDQLQSQNIILDGQCYARLILGCIQCKLKNLALHFFKLSIDSNIELHKNTYQKLLEFLKQQNCTKEVLKDIQDKLGNHSHIKQLQDSYQQLTNKNSNDSFMIKNNQKNQEIPKFYNRNKNQSIQDLTNFKEPQQINVLKDEISKQNENHYDKENLNSQNTHYNYNKKIQKSDQEPIQIKQKKIIMTNSHLMMNSNI